MRSKETDTQSEESIGKPSYDLNRKKMAIIVASVLIIALVVVFLILVLNVKKPKFRMRSAMVQNLNYSSSPNPSFNVTFTAEMNVKNPNFGYFRYGIINVTVAYRGTQLGKISFPRARVGGLSTRRLIAALHLNSNNVRNETSLGSDMRSGFLTLTSQSKMNGTVYVMSLGKQRKVNGRGRSAEMNCTLTVNLAKKLVQDIKCS